MGFRDFYKAEHPYGMSALDDYAKKNVITPYITRESKDRMVQVDVFSELMDNRIMFLGDEINSDVCCIALSQLVYLHAVNPTAPITIYIMSPGGEVYSGMALYDTMELIKKDCVINTTCLGLAASMGSVLMQGGTRGYRSALPHSRIMVHSASTGAGRITYPDLRIMADETEQLNNELLRILSESSGKPFEEVEKDCQRDCWVRADDALPGKYGEFGLIDKIIDKLN